MAIWAKNEKCFKNKLPGYADGKDNRAPMTCPCGQKLKQSSPGIEYPGQEIPHFNCQRVFSTYAQTVVVMRFHKSKQNLWIAI